MANLERVKEIVILDADGKCIMRFEHSCISIVTLSDKTKRMEITKMPPAQPQKTEKP